MQGAGLARHPVLMLDPDVLRTAVSLFYRRVLDDDRVASYFDGVDLDRLRAHQRAFLAAGLAGPDLYSGRELAEAHAGRGITAEAFDVIVEHLLETLEDVGADETLIGRAHTLVEAARGAVLG